MSGLTKQCKGLTAVSDLSFTVEPGRGTVFLGPNGAGQFLARISVKAAVFSG